MSSLRDKVAAESRLRFWRQGLRFPVDCRIRVFGLVLDRHEDYGIVAEPGRCETVESWWRGYYRYDAEKGRLVLTGFALGYMGPAPAVIPLRHVVEEGMELGRLNRAQDEAEPGRRFDVEEEVVRHLLGPSPQRRED